ncbi:ABC transporter permease [Chishuiella sp.]|uniref:ABC transporter permease n=1 Tax=Chishuiella sp. TaxID=1969467 RepID=UPI0028B0AFAD|nr:ABC transporter permease [Chishuiella sp.]
MLKNWFKIYIHNAIKNKWFTLLTILGLAIGIAGVIFSTLYWKDETSYDQWNPYKDRVYEVMTDLAYANQIWSNTTNPMAKTIKEKTDKIEETLYYGSYNDDVFIINNKKEYLSQIIVTENNFFNFFPFDFILGNNKNFQNNKNGVAIEEQESKRLFGDINPINKQIKDLDGNIYTIYGVYKQNKNSNFRAKYIINSLDMDSSDDWNNFNNSLLIKLKKGEDREEIDKLINTIYFTNLVERYAKNEGISVDDFIKKRGIITGFLQSLNDSRLNAKITGVPEGKGNKVFLQINLGLSVLILILSIINYVNLSTAQAIRRAKEAGIRKVLGASKKNIIYQFIFETTITVFVALLFAMALVEIGLPYYNQLINKEIEVDFISYLPYLGSVFFIVILLAGIFPAIYISNFEILKVLKGNFLRSKNGIWLRNVMLVLQFSIATFFIVAGFLITKQIQYMAQKELGFSGNQIINIDFKKYDLGNKRYDFYQNIKQDLLKIKGIKNVDISSFKFGSGLMNSSQLISRNKTIQIKNMPIDFSFIDMMNIKLKSGRNFDTRIASDTIDNIILNEAAINELGNNLKIDDKVKWNEHDFTIIGIVNNFNISSPEIKVEPVMLINLKTVDWLRSNLSQV